MSKLKVSPIVNYSILIDIFFISILVACSRNEANLPNWEQLPVPAQMATIRTLATTNEGIVYAGTTSGIYWASPPYTRWQNINTISCPVEKILITSKGTILAGTYRNGLLRSSDGGQTFTNIGFRNNIYLYGLVEPEPGTIFLSAMYFQDANSIDTLTGVFCSDDDGQSWRHTELKGNVLSLSIASNSLFAGTTDGLFFSHDRGEHWELLLNGLPKSVPVSSVVDVKGVLLAGFGMRQYAAGAGYEEGVYRSIDNGATWTKSDSGLLPHSAVHSLIVRNDTVLLAAGGLSDSTSKGVFHSLNHGRTWEPIGLSTRRIRTLITNSSGWVLAGTDGDAVFSEHGITYNWAQSLSGFDEWFTLDVQVHNSGRIFAGCWYSDDQGVSWNNPLSSQPPGRIIFGPQNLIIMGGYGEILRSTDLGNNWTRISLPSPAGYIIRLLRDSTGRIYASGRESGLFRSMDEGKTWETIKLPAYDHFVYGITITSTGALVVSDGERMLRSTDGGTTWSITNDTLSFAFDLHSCSKGLVFAATYANGLIRSIDDGQTWHQANVGIRKNNEYVTLTSITCLRDSIVLCGKIDGGVFYSLNRGDSWKQLNNGLRSLGVWALSSHHDTLYAATNRGIHRAVWPKKTISYQK